MGCLGEDDCPMKQAYADVMPDNCVPITLKTHSQYLEILNTIRKDTVKIVIVQIDGEDPKDPIVNQAKERMLLEKQEIVSRWFGTVAPGRSAVQYTFLKNRDFFSFLSSLESFFLVGSESPYTVKKTEFGFDDIAFLDSNGDVLFFTTTHEGYAHLNNKYQ